MNGDGKVLFEILEEGIGCLIFDRQEKLNALSSGMIDSLEAAIDRAATDASIRVLILIGAGNRAFVAGADIAEYRGRKTAQFIAYQKRSRRVFDKLDALPKPTIAAVRGYALGGGFEIALCCDIIVCSQSARFGLPEGKLGLSPGGGGTQRLPRFLGRVVASDLLLTGRNLGGERAFQLGLASECCSDDEVMEVALNKARFMLAVAPPAHTAIKKLLRVGREIPLADALTSEQEVLFSLYETGDAQEGIDAFLEKRKPRFRGN